MLFITRNNFLMRPLIGRAWSANVYNRSELELALEDAGFRELSFRPLSASVSISRCLGAWSSPRAHEIPGCILEAGTHEIAGLLSSSPMRPGRVVCRISAVRNHELTWMPDSWLESDSGLPLGPRVGLPSGWSGS